VATQSVDWLLNLSNVACLWCWQEKTLACSAVQWVQNTGFSPRFAIPSRPPQLYGPWSHKPRWQPATSTACRPPTCLVTIEGAVAIRHLLCWQRQDIKSRRPNIQVSICFDQFTLIQQLIGCETVNCKNGIEWSQCTFDPQAFFCNHLIWGTFFYFSISRHFFPPKCADGDILMVQSWKSWNSKFKKHRTQCVTVNGLNNHADIANAFADNFATVSTSFY